MTDAKILQFKLRVPEPGPAFVGELLLRTDTGFVLAGVCTEGSTVLIPITGDAATVVELGVGEAVQLATHLLRAVDVVLTKKSVQDTGNG